MPWSKESAAGSTSAPKASSPQGLRPTAPRNGDSHVGGFSPLRLFSK
ncbi:hypothetical protein CE91St30_18270 [Raoultibacter timonensis]|uniref:Uncharacterized protein n=1 Tax=Raoultibacter timonensis TaxID=1907662 RepID=A0ABN6MGX4_9ACTN|nr:hypothetical protein CE91St30_18270 [Raoultibacter timonensis]BDF51097.1 hypothetical protein CE91St31_18270 [Raoultibacter timonensis]